MVWYLHVSKVLLSNLHVCGTQHYLVIPTDTTDPTLMQRITGFDTFMYDIPWWQGVFGGLNMTFRSAWVRCTLYIMHNWKLNKYFKRCEYTAYKKKHFRCNLILISNDLRGFHLASFILMLTLSFCQFTLRIDSYSKLDKLILVSCPFSLVFF